MPDQLSTKSEKRVLRAEKIKRALEISAFVSLFFDASIAVVTLISLHVAPKPSISEIMSILDYGLTVIIIIAFILFSILLAISYYQKIISNILGLNKIIKERMERK